MAHTPYPGGVADYEHPSILASNDGNTWVLPTGAPDPIAAPASGFWPDPDLVLDSGGVLWCWFLTNRAVWSADGVEWSPPGLSNVLRPTIGWVSGGLSPALLPDDGKWKMWTVQRPEGSNEVHYWESRNIMGPWSAPTKVTMPLVDGRDFWHLDVIKARGLFFMLLTFASEGTSGAEADLYLATSEDGVNWQLGSAPLLAPRPGEWDSSHIYRSTLVHYDDDTFDIWYSARGEPGGVTEWRVGRTSMQFTAP